MQHSNCHTAITYHQKNPEHPSVSKHIETVHCDPTNVAMCNWMGNGARYACLNTQNDPAVPINVYGTPLKGGVSRISTK